jgi:hypothetical protein
MNHRIIGLYLPWQGNLATAPAPARNPVDKYRKALQYKANPRDENYLRSCFSERFPGGEFINIAQNQNWRESVKAADTVVFLYPDAIGLGFGRLEREVGRLKKNWAALRALNGRRRDFLLSSSTLWALRLRRLIERGMLGELIALLLFGCLTPVFLLGDLLRQRQ